MTTLKHDRIEMSWLLATTPKRVYGSWMSSEGHSAMTGAAATVDPRVGGRFTAWDGYISGVTRILEPNARIVQSWRSADLPSRAPDTRIEVVLRRHAKQTQLILRHTKLPIGDGARYTTGWYDFYLRPMVAYFATS